MAIIYHNNTPMTVHKGEYNLSKVLYKTYEVFIENLLEQTVSFDVSDNNSDSYTLEFATPNNYDGIEITYYVGNCSYDYGEMVFTWNLAPTGTTILSSANTSTPYYPYNNTTRTYIIDKQYIAEVEKDGKKVSEITFKVTSKKYGGLGNHIIIDLQKAVPYKKS